MYACTYVCVCMCIHVYVHAGVHVYVCVRIHERVCMYVSSMHVYMYTYMHTYIHTYLHKYVHIYIYIYTCACVFTHTRKHTYDYVLCIFTYTKYLQGLGFLSLESNITSRIWSCACPGHRAVHGQFKAFMHLEHGEGLGSAQSFHK